jgi:poly-gamma-glutamate capsule biosynthesis protein CapA/YwtB (metallophosphatase superfamily)
MNAFSVFSQHPIAKSQKLKPSLDNGEEIAYIIALASTQGAAMRLPFDRRIVPCLLVFLLLSGLSMSVFGRTIIGTDLGAGLPVDSLSVNPVPEAMRISWPDPPLQGPGLYLLFYSPDRDFTPGRATLLGATQRSYYVDPLVFSRLPQAFYRVFRFPQGLGITVDEVMIEDFEDGAITLTSYPGQDNDPNAWELTSTMTYDSSLFALFLYGNTWKVESIPPTPVTASTIWRASVMYGRTGQTQAIGVGDGAHELFYVFEGDSLFNGQQWITTYHSMVYDSVWSLIQMPIGRDWLFRYGSLPTINRIFYVNDKRNGWPAGTAFFDEIHDVTEDLPIVPQVYITAQGDSSQLHPSYQFTSTVIDPDSPNHTYLWDFGDSNFSNQPNPSHVYADRGYRTVSLMVWDDDSLFGDAAKHLQPPPGTPMPQFTLNNAGDVMMGRRYVTDGGFPGIIPTYGVNYIFQRTKPIFGDAADISMINLETSLTNQGYPHPTKEVVYRSDPSTVSGLLFAGFDYVALGNNHTMDYMEPGMIQTIHVLDSVKLNFSGSGLNDYWANRPAFFTQNGIRVAVLSYCNRDGRQDFLPPFLEAGYNKAGFAMFDEATLEATIPLADSLADLVIVQVHAGTEYDVNPLTMANGPMPAKGLPIDDYIRFSSDSDSSDRVLKQMAINLGADLVLCHHPHVLQGFEVYNGKLIAHSFGNFAFDQTYWETYPSMILYCDVDLDGFSNFTFKPVYVDDYVPTPATGELGEIIMRRMASYSRSLNSTAVSFDSATSTGKIATNISQVSENTRNVTAALSFQHEGSYWVSEPLRIEDPGFLSAIVSVSGIPGGATLGLARGRDVLYHGGMEYEGGWLWKHDSPDVYVESMYPHGGEFCLGVRRTSGQAPLIGDMEDRLPSSQSLRYTMEGWISGTNAKNAKFGAAFYQYRVSDYFINEQLTPACTGSFPWTRYYSNLTTPNGGWYVNIRCRNEAPTSGTGSARFDDIKLIEWINDWTTIGTGFTTLTYPTEHTFIQLRSNQSVTSATVTYRMTTRTIQQ